MDVQAFLITFREAFEAILIVGVIIMYLKRIDQTRWNKWVWLGVLLALVASYGVALAFQVVLTGYGSENQQVYLKIGIMIVSTMLITHMIMFMNKQSHDMQGKLQSQVATIISTGAALNMVLHSFLVVVREGIETVFFFAAITNGNIQEALQSWGALGGLIVALVVGYFFFQSSKKIKIGTFFRITSFLLMMIAAGLLVQAVGMLQDMDTLGTVYRTEGGEIGQVYNIQGIMPEHPQDEEHYIRDTGESPLINGDIGIFFKAFLGYTHEPSVEEFLAYWGYYLFVFLLTVRQKNKLKQESKHELNNAA